MARGAASRRSCRGGRRLSTYSSKVLSLDRVNIADAFGAWESASRGRIYNHRLGLKADWRRVFAEAAKLDKALETDCYSDREDLNLTLLKLAWGEVCHISLGTDAHHPWQLEFIELGLACGIEGENSSRTHC